MSLLSTGECLKLHKLHRALGFSTRSEWNEMVRPFSFFYHKESVLDEFLTISFYKYVF